MSRMTSPPYFVGVDVGGTTIKGGAVDDEGEDERRGTAVAPARQPGARAERIFPLDAELAPPRHEDARRDDRDEQPNSSMDGGSRQGNKSGATGRSEQTLM